jgi:hypothetical protein
MSAPSLLSKQIRAEYYFTFTVAKLRLDLAVYCVGQAVIESIH